MYRDNNRLCIYRTPCDKGRGAEIPGARSPGRLNSIRWRPIIVGPDMELASRHPSVAKNFEVAPRFFKNMWILALGNFIHIDLDDP
jgi:hypothetical protein